jgi:ribose 5-phosphate isomerase B
MTVVALGADHAGFLLKEALKVWLAGRGHAVLDFGTCSGESVDYPDYAAAVAGAVAGGRAERGVLVCGTGIGMAIAANKVAGVRAAQCGDVESARLSREHNDANVLALGARITSEEAATAIVEIWLTTEFQGGRHARRVEKLAALDCRCGTLAAVAHEDVNVPAR